MLFDKPSLRTRTTFEIAIRELGGHLVALQPDVALGRREPVADVARNLERWVDGVVIRTFSQDDAAGVRRGGDQRLHVVNALTDQEHPCQAIADFLTLQEQHRPAARTHDRLRRRRQQRRDVAGARRRDARRPRPRRQPGAVSAAARRRAAGDERARATARGCGCSPTPPMPSPAPMRSTPTPGRRWARKRRPTIRRAHLRAVSGERRADVAGQAGRAVHALPAGAPRRGSHRRRVRVGRRRSSSIRPRTACTARRRCC